MNRHSSRRALILTALLVGIIAFAVILFGPQITANGLSSLTLTDRVTLFGAILGAITTSIGVVKDISSKRNEDANKDGIAIKNTDNPDNKEEPKTESGDTTRKLLERSSNVFEESDSVSFSVRAIDEAAPSVPFVGPVPLNSADSPIFFGRDQEVASLLDRLTHRALPMVVLQGPSGAGKTSLIRAGLIPALRQHGYTPIYTRILAHPRSDVLYDIKQSLPGAAQAHDIPHALDCARSALDNESSQLVLIIDQLETCFLFAYESKEGQAFWYDIAHVLRGGSQPLAQVVFSIRGDWLFAFQRVSPEIFDAQPLHFAVLIDMFNKQQAADALRRPFEQFGVTLRPGLVDAVINDLTTNNLTANDLNWSEGLINPPQLQIVGAALYELALRANPSNPQLSVEDYESLNGARSIIGRHLEETMRGLAVSLKSPAWQILMRLAGSGSRRLPIPENELRKLATTEFDFIMSHLVKARLVMRLNDASYILTHDYLASAIVERVKQDEPLQSLKIALNYIDAGMADWIQSRNSHKKEVLLDRARYEHVWSERNELRALTDENYEFLVRNALFHGTQGLGFWLKGLSPNKLHECLSEIATMCVNSDTAISENAQAALKDALKEGSLKAEDLKLLYSLLKAAPDSNPGVGERVNRFKSARVAWWLRRVADWKDLPYIATFSGYDWLKQHRDPVLSALGAISIVALFAVAGRVYWLYRQGNWEQLDPLYASNVNTVAFTDEEVFVAVPRGPEEKDVWTLLRHKPGGAWQIMGRNIAPLPASAMVVTEVAGQERAIVSIRGYGLLVSDDGGQNWRSSNTGLRSYAIAALERDAEDPTLLFAGSNDMKGVFRSDDGGLTWRDISGEELFAASIVTLHDLAGSRGKLLAGTDDGRIELYDAQTDQWELVSAYPGVGAVLTLTSDPQDGERVYAGTMRGKLFRSDDAGLNWTLLEHPLNIYAVWSLSAEPGAPDSVFMTAYGVGGTTVWHTRNGGTDWERVQDDQFSRQYMKVNWLAGDLLLTGDSGVFESSNQGATWQYAEIGTPISIAHGLYIGAGAQGRVYANLGGDIFAYEDDDKRWYRGENLPAVVVRGITPHPENPDVAYVGLYTPSEWPVYRTEDGGRRWKRTSVPQGFEERFLDDVTALAVWGKNGVTKIYAGTAGCGVFLSEDEGHTWSTASEPDCDTVTAPDTIIDLAVDPTNSDRVYAAGDNTFLYVSDNGGATWSQYSLSLSGRIGALAVDPVISDRVYLSAGTDGFWRSDDGARTWTKMGGLNGRALSSLTLAPDTAETLFLATADGEILKTTNGGKMWAPVPRNPELLTASSLLAVDSRGTLLVGNILGGIWRFTPDTLR